LLVSSFAIPLLVLACGREVAPVGSGFRERCTSVVATRDAGVHSARLEVSGPRLARQLARAWCDSAAAHTNGEADVDGAFVTITGWESSVDFGRELAQLVREESESNAGEPFACHGPGTDTPPHEEVAGAVEGEGTRIVDLAPLHTRALRSSAAADEARRFCAHFASDHGRAAIIGLTLVVTDYPEILEAFEAERGSKRAL
jgi:hypothetical protein